MKPALLTLLAVAACISTPAFAQDAAAGKSVFNKCSSCHDVGPNAKSRMGPALTGVVGRVAGTLQGFTYSKAMVDKGASGLVWTPETLDAFITAPHDYVPGTKMPNIAVQKPEDRANLIAYLLTFSPDYQPSAAGAAAPPPAPGAAPAPAPAAQPAPAT